MLYKSLLSSLSFIWQYEALRSSSSVLHPDPVLPSSTTRKAITFSFTAFPTSSFHHPGNLALGWTLCHTTHILHILQQTRSLSKYSSHSPMLHVLSTHSCTQASFHMLLVSDRIVFLLQFPHVAPPNINAFSLLLHFPTPPCPSMQPYIAVVCGAECMAHHLSL